MSITKRKPAKLYNLDNEKEVNELIDIISKNLNKINLLPTSIFKNVKFMLKLCNRNENILISSLIGYHKSKSIIKSLNMYLHIIKNTILTKKIIIEIEEIKNKFITFYMCYNRKMIKYLPELCMEFIISFMTVFDVYSKEKYYSKESNNKRLKLK